MIPLPNEEYFDAETCVGCGSVVYYPVWSNGHAFCAACAAVGDDDETIVEEWCEEEDLCENFKKNNYFM